MKLWAVIAVISLFIVAASVQASARRALNGADAQSVTPTPAPQAIGPNDVMATGAAAMSPASQGCSPASDVQGNITTTHPTEAGRLFRDGVPSLCSTSKSFPGLNDSNPRHYATHWFANSSGVERCYAVDVTQACLDTNLVFFTTYLNSFNPADPGANYLADIGSSPAPTGTYSFNVPAGANFGIVVNEVVQDAGCNNYAFTLNECACWSASVTGSITNTDPIQTGRLVRNGIAATCPISKTFPGILSDSGIHYDTWSFANTTSTTTCYKVDVNAPNCAGYNMIFVSAYLGTYDPGNLAANYLADLGASLPFGSFSFNIPPGQAYTLVVNQVFAGYGCSDYKLDISNCGYQVCLPTVLR